MLDYYYIAQLPSNGLRLLDSIEGRRLAAEGDTKAVDVWGLFSGGSSGGASGGSCGDLLLADKYNRAIKGLKGFTADPTHLDVSLMFRDTSAWLASPCWHVSCVQERRDVRGDMLVVTAGLAGGDRRVYLARQNGGTFAVSQNFDLDPSYGSLYSIHYLLFPAEKCCAQID